MDAYDNCYYALSHFDLVTVEGYGQVSQYNLKHHIDYFMSAIDGTYYICLRLAGTLNGCEDDQVSMNDVRCSKLTYDDDTDSYYEPANYLALLVDRYSLDADITLPEVLYYIDQHAEKQIELNLAFAEAA